jgi:L-lactate dehydrogenase complex protein LldG
MTARDDILAAIRAARPLHDGPTEMPAAYRRTLDLSREALAARFAGRLADYGVGVTRIPTVSALPASAAGLFRQRGIRRIVVPPGLPSVWRPEGVEDDAGLTPDDLDEADGAMTGCLLAVAESGTIVLDGGAVSGRRALTLLPDYHLCVVFADQIAGLLPEAMPALAEAVRAGPITFFSGPSATADIELDRVQGVHGPRTLDVILVGA